MTTTTTAAAAAATATATATTTTTTSGGAAVLLMICYYPQNPSTESSSSRFHYQSALYKMGWPPLSLKPQAIWKASISISQVPSTALRNQELGWKTTIWNWQMTKILSPPPPPLPPPHHQVGAPLLGSTSTCSIRCHYLHYYSNDHTVWARVAFLIQHVDLTGTSSI